jgi:hypothetical protein
VEHVCSSGTTLWNSEEEGKEKRMIESQQYQNILVTSGPVDDKMLCIESCQIMGGWREGVRESCTDQSKAYSQLEYIEKPF